MLHRNQWISVSPQCHSAPPGNDPPGLHSFRDTTAPHPNCLWQDTACRLKGSAGSSIIYKVEPLIVSWKVYSFFPQAVFDFEFSVSADGQKFSPVKFSRKDYFTGKGDYSYYSPVLYAGTGNGDDAQYLKIEYGDEAQISRVEIKYGKHN